jgi:hypothetical protein
LGDDRREKARDLMADFDWSGWIAGHKYPKAAQRVFDWLVANDPDEPTWRDRDKLVELVVATVNDCSAHVIRFEGVDFDMRENFIGPT